MAKKKSKTGLQILPKNNPYLSQNWKKGGHCTGPLIKKCRLIFIQSLSILWETTEFHGVVRRIVNLLLNSHGREFILCTNQIGAFLSSHRQVRHLCVHTGKFAIFVFISARFAKFEFMSARFAKFWVNIGKIRQVWVNIGKIRQVLSSYRQVCQSLLVVNEPIL